METIKAQPTLRGFNAFVLARLVEARGVSMAEVAAWVIDRWIDENFDTLDSRYDISLEKYRHYRALQESTRSIEDEQFSLAEESRRYP